MNNTKPDTEYEVHEDDADKVNRLAAVGEDKLEQGEAIDDIIIGNDTIKSIQIVENITNVAAPEVVVYNETAEDGLEFIEFTTESLNVTVLNETTTLNETVAREDKVDESEETPEQHALGSSGCLKLEFAALVVNLFFIIKLYIN